MVAGSPSSSSLTQNSTDGADGGCSSGHWKSAHVAEIILLGGLFLAPYLARKGRLRKRDQES
jgi:hypothetical protein